MLFSLLGEAKKLLNNKKDLNSISNKATKALKPEKINFKPLKLLYTAVDNFSVECHG
jgi:hypothetical protein